MQNVLQRLECTDKILGEITKQWQVAYARYIILKRQIKLVKILQELTESESKLFPKHERE